MSDSDTDPDKAEWKQNSGMAADSAIAQVVCNETDLDQWDQEAEKNGFKSRSSYLYRLIDEGRAYRSDDLRNPSQAENRIEELEAEIERLETQLENERQAGSGSVDFDDPRFVKRFLAESYRSLDEVMRRIVESGALNDLVARPVEDQLYFLAAQGEVVYERGFGWKLVEENTGGER